MSNPDNYTVGWICGIQTEYIAAQEFLDDEHDLPEFVSPNDTNDYTLGRLGKHNVIIAVLPDGEYGTSSAASVATNMLHSFPNIRIGLMVGIGGGAPSDKHDIRLGDIVVSAPRDGESGVFQYDFGKTIQDQAFQHTRFLNQPPTTLRTALTGIQAQYKRKGHRLEEVVNVTLEKNPRLRQEYERPHPVTDRLFKAEVSHDSRGCAAFCAMEPSNLVLRHERAKHEDNPAIHYGLIASADQLMKDAFIRDRLATEKDVLCFEMEAAGLMNHFPCIIIRGICDYSDSHKNKEWQGYAAMVAAAYAKDLLCRIAPNRVENEKRIGDILSGMADVQKDTSERVCHVEQDINLAKLQPVEGAAYNSSDNEHERCHPDTRVDLLRQIDEWVDEPYGKCIYWLQGMAGTGKSTISRTVAERFNNKAVLGASFFFKRGGGDRGKAARFVPTIAAQLVHKHPCLAQHVRHAISTYHSIADKAINEQFEKLILQPLKEAELDSKNTIVVVVDALDECDSEEDARVLIYLLSQATALTSVRLRFFVTSRPELPIRLGFKNINGRYQDLILHEIPESIIEHDISAFLEFRLERIRIDYNDSEAAERHLPSDWPGQKKVRKLVEMAIPLFIFAATVCRFISDRKFGYPEKQLTKVLEHQTSSHISKLGAAYLPVLNQMVSGLNASDRKLVIEEFKDVVGSIVVLASHISTAALSRLLGVPEDDICNRLALLHSLLDVPSDTGAPVRLFHLSFRDFLIDAKNPDEHQFWVDETATHEKLATRCLQLLMNSNNLMKDICGLQMPGRLREDVDKQKIDICLPSEVQYACLYWVHHLKGSRVRLHDGHQALQFLRHHFLHWLEALSLIGRISESVGLVDELQSLVNLDSGAEVLRFLYDARRFILNCRSAIDQTPLQLYSSALVFAPERSVIRETFQEHINWIMIKPMERNWTPCLQTLEGHSGWVVSVAFSPDNLLASGSHDASIKIWDAATGALQRTLEGHSGWVVSVAFSPDSNLLASGSLDTSIKIWDTATGALQRTLEGHSGSVVSIAFSPDSNLLALGSPDYSIKIWDVATGALQQTFEGHSGLVRSVAFSPDSNLLASGSSDRSIKIWDVTTGALQQTLEGHSGWVLSIAFSPDSNLLASGSHDHSIKIWDTATGTLQQTLEDHSGLVRSVAFSPESNLLASGSPDHSIKIWDVATGALQRTLEGHSGSVRSVTFSPNSNLLASGSRDHSIKIWDAATGPLQQILEGHSGSVMSVAFSPDSNLLASGSHDTYIKIWDATTGALQQILEGHRGSVLSIAFSPDSNLLASGSHDDSIKIWDATMGALQQTFEGHSDSVESVAFSPDSNLLASGSHDASIKIWDTATGALQQTLEGHSGWVVSVAFSPDSNLLASGSLDHSIKIWDVATGALQRTLEGHSGWVFSIAFSPDSNLLASGSDDHSIKIWDAATGALQETLEGHSHPAITLLSFDSSGSYLDTGIGRLELADRTKASSRAPDPDQAKHHGYGLSRDISWITWDEDNVLWLPPDCRSSTLAISPFASLSTTTVTRIALGCSSGRVVVIGLLGSGPYSVS